MQQWWDKPMMLVNQIFPQGKRDISIFVPNPPRCEPICPTVFLWAVWPVPVNDQSCLKNRQKINKSQPALIAARRTTTFEQQRQPQGLSKAGSAAYS